MKKYLLALLLCSSSVLAEGVNTTCDPVVDMATAVATLHQKGIEPEIMEALGYKNALLSMLIKAASKVPKSTYPDVQEDLIKIFSGFWAEQCNKAYYEEHGHL